MNYEADEDYENSNYIFEQIKEEVRKRDKIAIRAKITNIRRQLDMLELAVRQA